MGAGASTGLSEDVSTAPGPSVDAPPRLVRQRSSCSDLRSQREQAEDAAASAPAGDGTPSDAAEPPKKPKEKKEKKKKKDGTWTLHSWLESLPLHNALTMALNYPADENVFDQVRALSSETLKEQLESRSEAIIQHLAATIWDGVLQLREQAAASATELNEKFKNSASHTVSWGSADVFHGGLERLIGIPLMMRGKDGTRSLDATIHFEHIKQLDSEETFTTSNGATTWSACEYEFVSDPKPGHLYPERPRLKPDMRRVALPLSAFREQLEEKNRALRALKHPELMEIELMAGRLYTGPMYAKYNASLRAKSGDPYLVGEFQRLCRGNGYVTTIHTINSCVLKLSQLTRASKIYRGLSGAALPDRLFVADSYGVRGGVEFGFSSTTLQKQQAVAYAQGNTGVVFESDMGMVARGASLEWLSQYTHEKEVLLPPLVGWETVKTRVDGPLLIVSLRMTLNQKARTIDEMLQRRKVLVDDMGSNMLLELQVERERRINPDWLDKPQRQKSEPNALAKSFRQKSHSHVTGLPEADELDDDDFANTLWQTALSDVSGELLREKLYAPNEGPIAHPPEYFNVDANFVSAIGQALELQKAAENDASVLQELQSKDRVPMVRAHLPSIMACLRHKEPECRQLAVDAIGRLPPEELLAGVAQPMLELCRDPRYGNLRVIAIRVLAKCPPDALMLEHSAALLALLEVSEHPLRLETQEILFRLSPPVLKPHTDTLVKMLSHEHWYVRHSVLVVLSNWDFSELIRNTTARNKVDQLCEDANKFVKGAAAAIITRDPIERIEFEREEANGKWGGVRAFYKATKLF